MQHSCREYTMPRFEKGTRIRGWILKNTSIGPVNIKFCYHDDRYSIEVRIQPLLEDNTASSVIIVNGVDKYVTESMLTKKEEDIASGKPIAKARPRQKPTVTMTSVSIPVLERKWVDINDHTITSVMTCQKPSPDCYDIINQSLEEATEQSTAVTPSTSAGRRSSRYQFWQKEEELSKYFNIARIQTLPTCTFEQFNDIQEIMLLILHCKTMTWNFDPIVSESHNWPDENLQGQAVHEKNQRILKHDAQPLQTHRS